MTTGAIKIAALGLCASVISGCATINFSAGFSEVGANVERRIGLKPAWSSGSELDREAAQAVQSALGAPLTEDRAIAVALLNNRELQAMYSDLGIAQADLVQAGLLRNPLFDAEVLFPVSGGRPDLELTAVWSFLDVLYRPLRKRVAAARLEAVKLQVASNILDFAARVRAAFTAHQGNEQMLELRQTILASLKASYEIALRVRDAGNLSDLDLARERSQLEAGKLALRSAELAVLQSREDLNVLMGLWGGDTGWKSAMRLAEIPQALPEFESFERKALEQSIDLQASKQKILIAGEQLGVDRATSLIPELHAGPRGARSEGSWEVGPTVEFPVPLFDQGQARIARAKAELRRAQQAYYAQAVRVRSVARSVANRLEEARERALYYRDVVLPLQQRIVDETQLHYNAMQLGPLQLLRAREQQIEAAANYAQALRDYWLSHGDYRHLLSGGLPGSRAVAQAPTIKRGSDATGGH